MNMHCKWQLLKVIFTLQILLNTKKSVLTYKTYSNNLLALWCSVKDPKRGRKNRDHKVLKSTIFRILRLQLAVKMETTEAAFVLVVYSSLFESEKTNNNNICYQRIRSNRDKFYCSYIYIPV